MDSVYEEYSNQINWEICRQTNFFKFCSQGTKKKIRNSTANGAMQQSNHIPRREMVGVMVVLNRVALPDANKTYSLLSTETLRQVHSSKMHASIEILCAEMLLQNNDMFNFRPMSSHSISSHQCNNTAVLISSGNLSTACRTRAERMRSCAMSSGEGHYLCPPLVPPSLAESGRRCAPLRSSQRSPPSLLLKSVLFHVVKNCSRNLW